MRNTTPPLPSTSRTPGPNLVRYTAALVLLAGFTGRANAHAIDAEAKLKAGVVTIEAYYDDNTPADEARVTITGEDGTVVASGRTDERGVWSFPAPPEGRYTAVIDAGAGHRKTRTLIIPPGVRPPPVTPASPQPAAGLDRSDAMTVSDGPSRAEFTGPGRLLWVGIGLGGIAAVVGAWAVVRTLRDRQPRAATHQPE